LAVSLILAAAMPPSVAQAGSPPTIVVKIKNHKFQPSEVIVPANKRIRLLIKNLDDTPEEFESHELHREKVIFGNSEGAVLIGPLKPGPYPFFGEFHESTAQGRIIAK
jgi:hypothetical protein